MRPPTAHDRERRRRLSALRYQYKEERKTRLRQMQSLAAFLQSPGGASWHLMLPAGDLEHLAAAGIDSLNRLLIWAHERGPEHFTSEDYRGLWADYSEWKETRT